MADVLHGVDEMKAFAHAQRAGGRRVALVPTMGFLHQGHLSLIREGRRRADAVVTSIFVNPTQFGPKEDLSRYPRDLEGDLAKCWSAGADVVFAPTAEQIYPAGFQTFVDVTEVSQGLCGARRPGHFRGVATVVTKLFTLVMPHVALFGEKDFQQLQVIRALNRDLHLGAEVVGMPTVREADGLAMSSRNSYLGPGDRRRALALSRGLFAAQRLAGQGVADAAALTGRVRQELQAEQLKEDYVELVDANTLRSISSAIRGTPARLLVAAYVGTTRLIDNVAVEA